MKFVRIEVEPSSGKDEIAGGDPLRVRVSAPASGGAANRAASKLLSAHFGERVRIVSGARKKRKTAAVG